MHSPSAFPTRSASDPHAPRQAELDRTAKRLHRRLLTVNGIPLATTVSLAASSDVLRTSVHEDITLGLLLGAGQILLLLTSVLIYEIAFTRVIDPVQRVLDKAQGNSTATDGTSHDL